MVVVIVAIIAVVFFSTFTQPAGYRAPTGNSVSALPASLQSLIIDPAAQVVTSSIMSDVSGAKVYAAVWTSSLSIADLYNAYLVYFPANQWQIANRMTSSPFAAGLYAVNGSSSASVGIGPISGAAQGSRVILIVMSGKAAPTPEPPPSLPSDFPKFLSVDPGAVLVAAQGNASSGMIVTFISNETVPVLADAFSKSFSAQGWTITQLGGKNSTSSAYLSGRHNFSRATVLLEALPQNKVQVQINYHG